MVGKQGESCDSVCKSAGQSCVASKFTLINDCGVMQKYMKCRGSCLASIGADQPAEVADDAPRSLNPVYLIHKTGVLDYNAVRVSR
ncbi:hypothetical protein QVD17_20698 [Tagetes erecta]|uniref:Uncharacterized protein n=1 Tax=Tagetes erecta TaxID=13708 RepID=A0AAD8KLZ5_TARER|nr:hypothetical protein QVD17_20698 [Tagetes erecta]